MRVKEIKKIYSNLANEYDEVVIKRGYRAHKIMSDWLIKLFENKHSRILDLGCGTGLSSRKYIEKEHEVIGIDASKGMLHIARKYKFTNLICQDLEKPLKVENNYFDAATLVGVMEFIENPLSLFKQINHKLVRGGFFLVTFPRRLPPKSKLKIHSYTKEEIEKLVISSGFKVIEYKSFHGYWKKTISGKEKVEYFGYLLRK